MTRKGPTCMALPDDQNLKSRWTSRPKIPAVRRIGFARLARRNRPGQCAGVSSRKSVMVLMRMRDEHARPSELT